VTLSIASPWCRVLLLGATLATPLAGQGTSTGGTAACDETLLHLASPGNGYRSMGDRCEGVYAKQVGGTTLFLASFTESFENYDLKSQDSLVVSWPAPADVALQIRAETMRRGRYYRMDTRRPAGDTAYHWSNHVLSIEQIRRRDLGIMGWMQLPVGRESQLVQVPLRVEQQQAARTCGSYELQVVPGERLKEVYTSLAPVGADGKPGSFLYQDQALGYGFYPAEAPIKLLIDRAKLPRAGIYYLKLAARLDSGGSATKEYYLYASPAPACPH
jgi:hypothetical protein